MKKIIITIEAIAILACVAGCSKMETTSAESTPLKINATIADDEVTKITLEKNDGGAGTRNLTWDNGDKILIYSPLKEEIRTDYPTLNQFNMIPGSLKSEGKLASFAYAGSANWSNAGDCVALYGKNDAPAYSGWTTRTGGTDGAQYFLCLNYPGAFPGAQQDFSRGNPQKEYLYMKTSKFTISGTDYSPMDHLTFQPVVSLVKVPVKSSGSEATLSSITLTCTGTALKGEWSGHKVPKSTYSGMDTSWGWTSGADTNDANKVAVLRNINQVMNGTTKYYYIVVAPGNHEVLTVTLTPTEGVARSFTLSGSSFTTTAGRITRLPVLDWGTKDD